MLISSGERRAPSRWTESSLIYRSVQCISMQCIPLQHFSFSSCQLGFSSDALGRHLASRAALPDAKSPLHCCMRLHLRPCLHSTRFQNILRKSSLHSQQRSLIAAMSQSLPRDVQAFIDNYPDQEDSGRRDNLKFYSNQLRSRPDGLLIDEMHVQWFGKYSVLESKHGFIQCRLLISA